MVNAIIGKTKKGRIELITGCMFAGKTEEFIRRINRWKYAKKNAYTFKIDFDKRYSEECIVSHSGLNLNSYVVKDSAEIKKILHNKQAIQPIDVVGIDEVQFFDEKVVDLIEDLADQGVVVIVNGLDKDFKLDPFKNVDKLFYKAEFVNKLYAICFVCGDFFANRTQRIINGKPATLDSPIILVDGEESYQARCRTCYVKP